MYQPQNRPSALVVDDSLTQAIELRMRLTRFGFDARTASNGAAALADVQNSLPSVVLTDLQMPEMDGLELVKQLKQQFPGLPVILMTAHGSEEIAVEALRSGAASYVPKKNLGRDLPKTLEAVLALSRSAESCPAAPASLVKSMKQYQLSNQPDLIPPLIGRLQDDLRRLVRVDPTEELRIAMALREALMNAIEHGNLEVSSSLRESNDEDYARLIEARSRQSPYAERRVELTAEESAGEVVYVVRDEGTGFDPATLPDPTDPENLEKASGRGLLLIHAFMDSVTYNDRGNQITMTKRSSPAAAAVA